MPYRTTSLDLEHADDRRAADRWDDRVLGLVIVALTAPRIVAALLAAEGFGTELTVATVVAILGALLVAARR